MVLKLRSYAWGPLPDLLVRADSHLVLALGQTPPGLGPPRITTVERLEQYYALRQRFISARQYQKAWNGYWEAVDKYNREIPPKRPSVQLLAEEFAEDKVPEEKKAEEKKPEEKKAEEPKKPAPPQKPASETQKEVLLAAMDRKLPVLILAHSRADIGYAVRLKEEFGLEATVAGCTEGYRAAEDLARAGVKAAVGPALLTRWSLDLLEHRESNAADLARASVPVALCGLGGEAFPAGALRLEASVAVRGGLAPDLALRAITAEPAAALGLGERLGSIAPGKDGDLVIIEGDPLSALSRVLRVVVEGRVVFEREKDL
jgi:imidazolonepropionase-like amidohydrolase